MSDTFNNIQEIGNDATKKVITQDFGWIFREKTKRDIGIDAEAETKLEGLLIQIQIKTGMGNFTVLKKKGDGLMYYVDKYHYDYWTKLKAPVLFVAHIPEKNKTYWQIVAQDTLEKTKKAWKLFIPFKNELNKSSKDQILYYCINMPELEVNMKSDLKNQTIIYQTDVIDVDSFGGFNSKKSIELRQKIAKKTQFLQDILRLRKLAYNNPTNYPSRLELSTVYMEMNDLNNATIELTSLITALTNCQELNSRENRTYCIWARYYLNLISDGNKNYIEKIYNTRLTMLGKVTLFGENVSYVKVSSLKIMQDGETFEMDKYDNYFILPLTISLESISKKQFEYEITLESIPCPNEVKPQIKSCTAEFELGLRYQNEYLYDYSTPF